MDDVIEQPVRKTESEELLRIFPINMVIGTRKLTKENKDIKKGYFPVKVSLSSFTTYRT